MIYPLHLQHLLSFSVSLKNMVCWIPRENSSHLQHSIWKIKLNIYFNNYESIKLTNQKNNKTGLKFKKLKIYLRSASWVLTHKFALWFRTEWFRALPVANWFSTNSLTFGFGDLTVSNTVGWVANVDTFRAVHHLTSFIRAHRLAVRSGIINSRI